MKLTVFHLFGDRLNLYGDKGNIASIVKRCEWRGIETEVRHISEKDIIDLSDADIVFLGGGSENDHFALSRLKDKFAPEIKKYVEDNGVMLCTCGGFTMMGNFYENSALEKIPCFEVFDIDTYYSEKRFSGDVTASALLNDKTFKISGFENHSEKTDIKGYAPLAKVISGYGNDGESEYEGMIYKNTLCTYLHGPLLPKNPEISDYLIEAALKKKYPDFSSLTPLDDAMENKAREYMLAK